MFDITDYEAKSSFSIVASDLLNEYSIDYSSLSSTDDIDIVGNSNIVSDGNISCGDPFGNCTLNRSQTLEIEVDTPCHIATFIFCSVVISIVGMIGLVLNSLSFYVLSKDKNNAVATFLLKSLSVADNCLVLSYIFIIGLVYGPGQLTYTRPLVSPVYPIFITYINPLSYICHLTSVWITVLLAVNRFLVVCRPFTSDKFLTLNVARLQVAFVVFISIAFNLPRFFIYEIVWLPSKENKNVTVMSTNLTSFGRDEFFAYYYLDIFYTIVLLIMPFVFLVLFNSIIIFTISKSQQRMRRRNSVCSRGDQQDRNLTIVMIVICIEFLVCNLTDRILISIRIHQNIDSVVCPETLLYVTHFSNFLVLFNSCTDFIIYVIFKRRFRRLLLKSCCDTNYSDECLTPLRQPSFYSDCETPTRKQSNSQPNGKAHRFSYTPTTMVARRAERLLADKKNGELKEEDNNSPEVKPGRSISLST
ncbi:hypothetical protein HELRODRAFT_191511 [Helobdella robusta]|uniref:G-protein coupled receptors family 1 profile domain-containing protein n=1 Tax=Helobdella robusta TaxID=6412 RepID=T1FT20_HELRO|nr:hypothetical protein HELRODRAFT_191511 [Helobdella robusta]ESO04928.1 hypothetical protein HELRODRAFT_191511 [Helobdella robusta]